MLRIGVDVGGTFTDCVGVDPSTGELSVAKVPTSRPDVERGTAEAIETLTRSNGRPAETVFHGTTLVTNAIVERKVPRVGLICTSGFRDILEIRRTQRARLYDIHWLKPASLVDRRFRREVVERIDKDGEILVPLDREGVLDAVEYFRKHGISDIAVAFLFGFANPQHELEAARIIHEFDPSIRVSLATETLPEIREYERTSTTVLNAMAKAVIEPYLESLEDRLSAGGFDGSLQIMTANGGTATSAYIRSKRSIDAFGCGPAAGVTAAAELGRKLGINNLLTFDMGGTTTDVGLVWGGEPVYSMEEEVDFGIPLRVPRTYIKSVGAGGGSLASIDEAGALQVGPESAGAIPGPACYGNGGDRATVTDANLVLGYIDPAYFLGGTMQLTPDRAFEVVSELGDKFGWTVQEAALAIIEIARANMVQGIREVTMDRGYDPRDFSLLAFGGGGALYAADVADALDLPRVVVPPFAGVFSALGCLFADYKHEYVKTVMLGASVESMDALREQLQAAREVAGANLGESGVSECPRYEDFVDMRYVGQAFEVSVPVAAEISGRELIAQLKRDFTAEHERLYGFSRSAPVEIVNLRVRATVDVANPDWVARSKSPSGLSQRRKVWTADGEVEAEVWRRDDLPAGLTISGPAIVVESEATVVVPAGFSCEADEIGSLIIERRA